MFEILELAGTPRSSIRLQTQRGTDIDNEQAAPPDDRRMRVFERLVATHFGWTVRKPPCGVYNCAGHVWASRRTAVYEQKWYDLILEEDGYRMLQGGESPVIGDLALYRLTTGEILHVGLIMEIRRLSGDSTGSSASFPWALSKWDDASGEVLHHFRDVPYAEQDYTVSFWTDRP